MTVIFPEETSESGMRNARKFRLQFKEDYLFALTLLIVLATLAFNRFFLLPEWAESREGTRFVDTVSLFYPALQDIKNNWSGYTPQVGVLFALMGAGMPAHFMLGVLSLFFMPRHWHQKFIYQCSWREFLPPFLVWCVCGVLAVCMAFITGYGRTGAIPNQASDWLIVQFVSWALMCAPVHYFGRDIGAFLLKASFHTFKTLRLPGG